MCPLKGCKEKSGMCGHEKMALALAVLVGGGYAVLSFL
jgi:hypothetical protein